jgi:NitT/TauT family transport system substrate-binding protein
MMVYLIYNRSPFALIVKSGGPIKALKDLEGKSLGVPAGSATHRMLAPLESDPIRLKHIQRF